MSAEAYLLDQSGRDAVEYRPLKPIIIRAETIEREIERLAALPAAGRRRSVVVHPGLLEGFGLMPSCTVSICVLLPGERTTPHRHNSSVVNFCVRGTGRSVIAGRDVRFRERDVWTTPPWAIHQHINDSDEIQVRLSYSNSSLLDRLQIHIVDETPGLDPNEPLGDPTTTTTGERGEVIGDDGAALLTYEQLISPDPPYQTAKLWPWPVVAQHLYPLKERLGKEYEGRRLFLLYDPTTGRTQGTTATFFATMAILPAGQVDVPHRHSSAAINYYFEGSGWSKVGGERYEWGPGDLMLSAPGWMPHGHAANDDDVLALTIQDSPIQIALGSLLWMENIKKGRTEALGVTEGFPSDTPPVAKVGEGPWTT
jgi:gentisate 1,2-dioxygenase